LGFGVWGVGAPRLFLLVFLQVYRALLRATGLFERAELRCYEQVLLRAKGQKNLLITTQQQQDPRPGHV